ncbi:MAG: L-threonylcarbamoyladenylate synthase [Gammaproteobacteria bacterium]
MSSIATAVTAVDAANPGADALAHAATILRNGGLVAFPTETFYGLGASATDAGAVRRVAHVKHRDEAKPLLVLVDSMTMAESLATDVTPRARQLMLRHWPGALTLVLRARADLPRELTAGTGTIGVRLSPHPIARGLVSALGAPVTAPSANLEGAAPPSTAAGVLRVFAGTIDLVLDGGPTPGGLPSSVVDVTGPTPRVLRHGAVSI